MVVQRNEIPLDLGKNNIVHEGGIAMLDRHLEEEKYAKWKKDGDKRLDPRTGWMGITDKYWMAVLIPPASERIAPEFRADQGWITIGGDTTSVQFTNLVPDARYMFVVVAFDEAGAFSPLFSLDTNIVRFIIGFAAAFGPSMTIFNESFFYQYPGASYNPAAEVFIEVPAGTKVNFNWFATPPDGAILRAYRWMLDGDVFDECTQTIIQQVDDLKTLVNEFSTFARMPRGEPTPQDLNRLVDEALVLFREGHGQVVFEFSPAAALPVIDLDREGVKRALLNVLDNAVAACKARSRPDAEPVSRSKFRWACGL